MAVLEGVPELIDYELPIDGIDGEVFKMIIEWIYSMDIPRLNGMSSSLLYDLERLYIAADLYQIKELCDSIIKYLEFLINEHSFGDICQIAKNIGSKCLERAVARAWIAKSEAFNQNDGQIDALIFGEEIVVESRDDVEVKTEGADVMVKREGQIKIEEGIVDKDVVVKYNAAVENEKIVAICHKIIQASEWEGETLSKTCVITCLTSLLSVRDDGAKKRKIALEIQKLFA